MTQNTIRTLLDEVTQTGRVPEHTEIRAAITTYRSVAERRAVEKQVRIAAKRIVNALDANLPDAAAEHAADVGEVLSAHTAAGAVDSGDEAWTRSSERKHQAEVVGAPRTHGQKALTELLSARTKHRLTADDLDRVAEQVPEDERDAFRSRLREAGEQINQVYATGNQADARNLARQHAFELGAEIPEPEPVDPSDAFADDPRALAALVQRH